MYISLVMIHYWDVPAALGVGDRPLSADLVLDYIKYSGADCVCLPPTIAEEYSQDKEAIAKLSKLSWVAFGGGKPSLMNPF